MSVFAPAPLCRVLFAVVTTLTAAPVLIPAAQAGAQSSSQPSPVGQGSPAAPPAVTPAAPAAAAAKPATPPGDPKPFDEVIKDADRVEGLLNFYRTKKNDLYLEIPPDLLDKPFFMEITSTTGLGGSAGGVTTGDPLWDAVFSLKRVREQIFLVVKQTNYRTKPDEPIRKALERSFSDAILAAFKVESQPHPDRKSILVNCGSLFFADLAALGQGLTAGLRTPVALDREKSYIDVVKSFPENSEIEVQYHYAAPRAAGANTLADGRSAPVRLRYSVIALKETGYQPRLYDSRVGYFVSAFRDLTDDDPKEEFTRYIMRWNLEKQDENAALSPPKKPIVFWIDNAVPKPYRKTVADGLLMWNRAFERIGIKDAIVVKQIADNEDIDPFDIRYNVLRWAVSPGDGYAVALFRTNPITGEILNASIRVDASIFGITRRSFRLEDELKGFTGEAPIPGPKSMRTCAFGRLAAQEASFAIHAMDLAALSPDGIPLAARQKFIDQFVIEVIAHEMGHILGLRHNFRASTAYSSRDLQDPAFTAREGVSASVMDYAATNLAPLGGRQADYFTVVPGAYDHWAIEYGYRRWPALTTPESELPALAKIASRAGEPALAFATDEDVADMGFAPFATDPLASRFDLSSDPLGFAIERGRLARSLFAKLHMKSPLPGESYQDTRQKFAMLLGTYLNTFRIAGKYIGGIHSTRARRGDPNAPNAPFRVVPAADQRRALDYIREGLFGEAAFRFPPSLLNKLAVEKNIHWGTDSFSTSTIYSMNDRVQAQQRALLAWLFTPGNLSRLRDNEARVTRPADTLKMAELFTAVTDSVFAEVRSASAPVEVRTIRRDLQRDYLNTLLGLYLGGTGAPADAQSLARLHLRRLSAEIAGALARNPERVDATTRAHLEHARERIVRALSAHTVTGA